MTLRVFQPQRNQTRGRLPLEARCRAPALKEWHVGRDCCIAEF